MINVTLWRYYRETMIIIPLVIGALAVVITLVYASYLDILDRRVPFITWYPMLVIGLPAAGIALFFFNNGLLLFAGYIEIVSVILFIAYLITKDEKNPFNIVLLLPVIGLQLLIGAYFFFVNNLIIVLLSGITILLLVYSSFLENKKIENLFSNYWPFIYFTIGSICWFSYVMSGGGFSFIYLGLINMFCLIFFLFGHIFFGWADAWALIFITLIIPIFPFQPLAGYPIIFFFPYTVLINAIIINIVVPIGIFAFNLLKGNKAPLRYMFLGYPVDSKVLDKSYGFVMEEFNETEGVLSKRFLGIWEMLASMISGPPRIYTKELRLHPEKFQNELKMYKKAGSVWISYGIPFIIPITIGLVTGLFIGDILTICMSLAGGA
jgi:archaeal preflagellin peptidase FlaK